MQIRQKEEARDIDTRDVSLRAVGETGIWVHRAALASLSREQKKQWNSYSHREQVRILAVVEKKVERRTRYQSGGVAETQKPVYQNRGIQQNSIYQKQEEVSLAYRISDTGQRRIQNRTGRRGAK